jgi:hypothetical protein
MLSPIFRVEVFPHIYLYIYDPVLKNNGGEGDPRSELTSIIHTEK